MKNEILDSVCTSAWERDIDPLVYRLYDLTYTMSVVDLETPVEREKYESMKSFICFITSRLSICHKLWQNCS